MLLPVLLLANLAAEPAARADLGVVLADPTTIGISVYTHAGHSLVYLSGVCAESPIRARLCQPGEQGSVVTTYPNFREGQPYSFNLVPLALILYGSSAPEQRLLYASAPVKEALEAHARAHFLKPACQPSACPDLPHSYWRDMVAATANRDFFIYAVRTTPTQDQATVDWLNSRPNVNHYNPLLNNCANFTSELVNAIFPHSVHRDYLNDLFMMGPKAAARSFSHWAVKRPELGFYSLHFTQQPGSLPRAGIAQSGTETAIHMKKYLIPAAFIGDHEVAGSFFVAYYLTGRFNLYKEYSRYPAPSVVEQEKDARAARQEGDTAKWSLIQASLTRSRNQVVGDKPTWVSYRERFQALLAEPELATLFAGGKQLFPASYAMAPATVDDRGLPWLALTVGPLTDLSARQVGLSSANLLAPGSDPALALQLMLGRVAYQMRAKNHMREPMEEFDQDWALLEQAHQRFLAREPSTSVATTPYASQPDHTMSASKAPSDPAIVVSPAPPQSANTAGVQ